MLEGRVLRRTSDHREFVEAEFDGSNHSGIVPLDDKVLLRMDEHAERTSGGIIVVDETRARQSMASESGVIIALGDTAFMFSDDGQRAWSPKARKPYPGDRVVVDRYAGRTVQGVDGIEYRLVGQRSVGAVLAK